MDLHPNRFQPRKEVLEKLGVSDGEKFVILRFNSFDSHHDVGVRGFSMQQKKKLVQEMERHARVFISSEVPLSKKYQKYALPVGPEWMHDALYHAMLLVGDTQTSTTEAACLGTPAVRSNTWVGPNDMTNFIELEKVYGLIFNIVDPVAAIARAVELIQRPGKELKAEWMAKKDRMLEIKIDLTGFLLSFVEGYPESLARALEQGHS